MADDPELIPGIHIYCDRWCGRCAYTSRCLQFRLEAEGSEGGGAFQNFDALNTQFWKEMGEALVQVMRFIRDIAAKGELEADDLQCETSLSAPPATLQRDAREHPCAIAALHYAGMVNEWFAASDELPDAKESLLTHPPLFLEEATEVIRHYHYFIYPKIVRAIEGRPGGEEASRSALSDDASGTAKVALIAIDRSLAAWSLLYKEYPDQEDSTLSILLHLDRLRRSVEVIFPDARAFIRQGFDAPHP